MGLGMRKSLRTAVSRGVTVLVGLAVVALVTVGAADATTSVTSGVDSGSATADRPRAFDGEHDGNGIYIPRQMDSPEEPDPFWCEVVDRCQTPDR